MSGIDYLADTNALIYLLNGNPCMKPYLQEKLHYSLISEIELLSFYGITETEERGIKKLLSFCNKILLSEEIKEIAISIRKKYKTKLPDAIVAASAIANNISLITADKDFIQIKELHLVLIIP